MSRTLFVLILCLIALRLGVSLGLCSILGTVPDKNWDSEDYVVDLSTTNFDVVLEDTPATFAVVKFFANCHGHDKGQRQRQTMMAAMNDDDEVTFGNNQCLTMTHEVNRSATLEQLRVNDFTRTAPPERLTVTHSNEAHEQWPWLRDQKVQITNGASLDAF